VKGDSEANQNRRRREADERNAAWRALTPKEQLETLDRRHGKGLGAKRQRERIAAQMRGGKA
jgi:hypothetical protein